MTINLLKRIILLCLLTGPVSVFAQDWKSEAWERIDTIRKSEIEITVTSATGVPIQNARVHVKLSRHAFPFGSYLRSKVWNNSPYQQVYKENYLKYFNGAGMEIGLKPRESDGGYWEGQAEIATPWFDENNFIMRGAHLVWEGYDWFSDEAREVYTSATLTDKEKGDSLIGILDDHLYHAIPKWNIAYWDVINEPVVNDKVNELLPGFNTFVHWFKLADSLRTVFDADFGMVLNENNVISGNANWSSGRIADFQAIIDDMLSEGAPIEMLGFQGRIQNGMLSPETMYERLLQFDKYDLPYQVSEFEIRDNNNYKYTDQQLRQLTEETMTIYFSHPKVQGFWHWTFMDDEAGTMPWALFNYDGTPKPTAEKWIELMEGKFTTDETLVSDVSGSCLTRAYKGEYEIEVSYLGSSFTQTMSLDEDAGLTIELPYDLYYSMSGLEDSASYDLDQSIQIDIRAFSNQGNVSSVGFFLNGDSIAGALDETLSMDYTPTASEEGWNEVTISLLDDQGNSFSHSISVYFGNRLPEIEILARPDDIIYTGSSGHVIKFNTWDPDGTISLLKAGFKGQEEVFTDSSGIFEFSMDKLPEGDYDFIIEATDDKGGQSAETISFTVALGENALPDILIVFPYDGTTFPEGNPISLVLLASDTDGTIATVEILINGKGVYTGNESSFTLQVDTLSVGAHEITAIATDDRGGKGTDIISLLVEDNTSTDEVFISPADLDIYPNPVSDILHFSKPCDFAIYTIQGRKILERTSTSRIDVSGLDDGIYIVRTLDVAFKIIKK